jgi:hypothetical protein
VTDPGFRPLVDGCAGGAPGGGPKAETTETTKTTKTAETAETAAAAALAELQHLARAYVPDAAPPSDAAGVRSLVGAVDRALRTFLMANVQIEFFWPGDAEKGRTLERARQLGHALLDWRGDAGATVASRIERDAMELALDIARAMDDADATLDQVVEELSPAAIEAATRGAGWPFAGRARWRELGRRHAAVATTVRERRATRAVRASGALGASVAPADPDAPAPPPTTLRLPVRRVFWGI